MAQPNSICVRVVCQSMNLHLLNGISFNGYCWYTLHRSPHIPINVQEPQICPFLKIFFWKELKNYKEGEDQINANKILHSSAIDIQSMTITRSLCKAINDQKCFFLIHLYKGVSYTPGGCSLDVVGADPGFVGFDSGWSLKRQLIERDPYRPVSPTPCIIKKRFREIDY